MVAERHEPLATPEELKRWEDAEVKRRLPFRLRYFWWIEAAKWLVPAAVIIYVLATVRIPI